jgi:glycosyltransferase involved in cell wall biosynthesis
MKQSERCLGSASGDESAAPELAQMQPHSAKPGVSIVVPMYRSSETVRELHERITRVMDQVGEAFELILVDDGCPAGSAAAGREIERGDLRVRIVSLPHNRGQHRAVLAGLAQAQGDWCLVMDADLQDPPEAIPALLAERSSDVGAIFAGRRGRYESRGRLFTSWLFKTALSALCGVPRDAGMFVLLHRGLVATLLAMSGPEPFVVAMIGCSGFAARSIPVARATRPRGHSAYSSLMRLRSAWRGLAWACRWRWQSIFG